MGSEVRRFAAIEPNPSAGATTSVSAGTRSVGFHAFGLLCGVLFKKFHIVVTAVVGVILFAVFMQVCSYITPYETREIICLVAAIIATITFTILAYRLFCRWQVVTRKFVNL